MVRVVLFFSVLCMQLLFGEGVLRPVPWLTEGAIAFLEEFIEDHPEANILEFGSGASTVWLSKKNVNLYSVEHNPKWYGKITSVLKNDPDCRPIHYFLRQRPYYTIARSFPDNYFDLIIVDGRNRKGCIFFSLSKLKRNGVLMLDNAERRYYSSVFSHMSKWERCDAYQTYPDSCGFFYNGWLTSWWVKP